MGHFINNAQGGKTAEWMMQSQWKLFQLQLNNWGSSTCVHYFPSVRRFELTSVRHGVCRRLGYCDGWKSKIILQDETLRIKTPTEIHSALREVCGVQTVDRSTVSRWATRFSGGRVTINDYPRPGRPKTSTDERSVKLVADFLAEDRRATCEEISQGTGISPTSVFRILTKDLQKRINLYPMGPSLLDCWTETETAGNCNITETKI